MQSCASPHSRGLVPFLWEAFNLADRFLPFLLGFSLISVGLLMGYWWGLHDTRHLQKKKHRELLSERVGFIWIAFLVPLVFHGLNELLRMSFGRALPSISIWVGAIVMSLLLSWLILGRSSRRLQVVPPPSRGNGGKQSY